MLDFLKGHIFLFFCIFGLIWLGGLILTQIKYKKNGVRLDGKVVGHVNQTSNYFPVYEFVYNGETLRVDSYNGEKNPMIEGEVEPIYYLPGNQKGVFAERNIGIKAWQIFLAVACVIYIVLDVVRIFVH